MGIDIQSQSHPGVEMWRMTVWPTISAPTVAATAASTADTVGRTRLTVLAITADFPRPVICLRMGSIWELDEVIAWATTCSRTLHMDTVDDNTGLGKTPAIAVGAAELIDLLGVGRTQLSRIQGRADFPVPAICVKVGSVWDFADVLAWAALTGRALYLEDEPVVGQDITGRVS